jgi:hypothetical protein
MRRSPAAQPMLALNGSLPIWRTHTADPERSVEPSACLWQVTERSSRAASWLKANCSANGRSAISRWKAVVRRSAVAEPEQALKVSFPVRRTHTIDPCAAIGTLHASTVGTVRSRRAVPTPPPGAIHRALLRRFSFESSRSIALTSSW